jgi:16S rRNA (cytidine1402-2'-O)-methyltransferase
MAGTLYVVATPIGNLEDITLRALRVLREVAVVAAEDTRRTGQLLRHFQIGTPLISVREHNEGRQSAAVVDRLRRGEAVALVTDAGTPAVSDPGAKVVAAVAEAGFKVEPVPGASAVMAALSASGVDAGRFTFLGFPPHRGNDRNLWFDGLAVARREGDVVFFEAPHRIAEALATLDVLAIDRIIVFRELTKLHESVYRGSPREVLAALTVTAGEFTVVVPRASHADSTSAAMSDADVLAMFGQIADKRGRAAVKDVSARTGRPVNEVYDLVRKHKTGAGQHPDRELD